MFVCVWGLGGTGCTLKMSLFSLFDRAVVVISRAADVSRLFFKASQKPSAAVTSLAIISRDNGHCTKQARADGYIMFVHSHVWRTVLMRWCTDMSVFSEVHIIPWDWRFKGNLTTEEAWHRGGEMIHVNKFHPSALINIGTSLLTQQPPLHLVVRLLSVPNDGIKVNLAKTDAVWYNNPAIKFLLKVLGRCLILSCKD